MTTDNPFVKSPEPVVEPAATEPQVAPEVGAETPAVEVPDPIREKYGIAMDEVGQYIEKANQYSWLEEDTFAKTLLSKYKEGKSIEDVVKIIGKDWSKAADLDLVKEDLARQGITEDDLQEYQIQKLYGEFSEGDDSPEAKLARKQIERTANELRAKFIKEQEEFGKPVNHQEKEMEQFRNQLQQWHEYIDKDDATKTLVESKRITFNHDGREQNLEVDASKLLETVKSPGKFIEQIGQMPLDMQYKVAAFLSNPNQFIGQLVELGKVSAKEALLKEERNPEPQPHIEPELRAKFTDKPIKDWTTEEKREFLKNAVVKR
jgi:hypothetical protein